MSWAPEFLIVGAARSGTTSLHYLLQQHPAISMSREKEPNFFAFDGDRFDVGWSVRDDVEERLRQRSILDAQAYRRQFARADAAACRGEASPSYLPTLGAARRIQSARPDVKVIAVLREPVSRAYSHHLQHAKADGSPPATDFAALLEREQEQLELGVPAPRPLPYVQGGLYHDQVERFLQTFGPGQVQVHLFDDLGRDPAGVLRSIAVFLGVDPSFRFDTGVRYNVGGRPSSPFMARLLQVSPSIKRVVRAALPRTTIERMVAARARLQQATSASTAELDGATRGRIANRYFVDDRRRLETLLARDLSDWGA